MNIALIPARGGSKRIPRKNIRDFCGKPIIAHSIEVALESKLFAHVVVSTDDQEISKVAASHGAEVPFVRPKALADDFAATLDVMEHGVRACLELGWCAEAFCCLYATAPFVTVADLKKGFETLAEPDTAYAFSATRFGFPVQRAIKVDSDGRVRPAWPEFIGARSQDLEPMYHDAGQFYWGTAEAFLRRRPVFSSHSKAILLPTHQVQDIDDLDDWHRAELMYAAWHQERSAFGFRLQHPVR